MLLKTIYASGVLSISQSRVMMTTPSQYPLSSYINLSMSSSSSSSSSTYPSSVLFTDRFPHRLVTPPARRRNIMNVSNLQATIIPISKDKIYDLGIVSRDVTGAQWNSYWGSSSKERLQRVLESLLLAYGGAWFAWFVSFMSGGLAPFVGTFLIFNWLYSPWINAKKRNDKFWSSKESRKYYAIYSGKLLR